MSTIYPPISAVPAQKYVVIERARGYSSSWSNVYDESRYINATLYLFGSGRGAITLIPDDDVAASKTWTVLKTPDSGTAPNCVTDRNDSTYCSWSAPASAETDLLRVDLGSAMYGTLRLLAYFYSSSMAWRVYVSNDGSTWSLVGDLFSTSSGTNERLVYINGYRYLKISVNNTSTSAITVSANSVEFYPDTALPYSRSLSGLSKRLAVFVYNAYYQLLEVVSL